MFTVPFAVQKLIILIREIQVGSLGQEDPLEEEIATYSSILAGVYIYLSRSVVSDSL